MWGPSQNVVAGFWLVLLSLLCDYIWKCEEVKRARPAGITPRAGCRCCRTRLDGSLEASLSVWGNAESGWQLCPRVSRGSFIDCTAVAFNYDSNRSIQKAAGAKVTFLHSDYSRLLCGATVLCFHPIADQVWFVWLNRQETNTCKYSYICQIWLENLVQRHRPSR